MRFQQQQKEKQMNLQPVTPFTALGSLDLLPSFTVEKYLFKSAAPH
jgi:hypothetical protein